MSRNDPWAQYKEKPKPDKWALYKEPAALDMDHVPKNPPPPLNRFNDERDAWGVAASRASQILPGLAESITGIPSTLKAALTGNARELMSGIVSMGKPFVTLGREAGAYAAPNTVAMPSEEDQQQATRGLSTQLGGLLLAKGAKEVNAATQPKPMLSRAEALRASGHNTRASLYENVARLREGVPRGAPITRTQIAEEEAARVPKYTEPESAQPYESPKIPQPPGVSPSNEQFLENIRRPSLAQIQDDELRRAAQWGNEPVTETAESYTPPRTEPPGVSLENQELLRQPPPVKRSLAQEIEAAIAPSGRRAKLSTLRTVPQLQEVAPEIAGQPKGPLFDSALMKAHERLTGDVVKAESEVPRTVTVPKTAITSKLAELAADYKSRGLEKIAGTIEKEVAKWDALPDAIPWDDFIKRKRGFFQEHNVSSAPMMKAYRVLMDASSAYSGSEALKAANRGYSTVRRALDNANIDPKTGRRIMDVGKIIKQ